MGIMAQLDVDRQELSDVAEAAARSMVDAINEDCLLDPEEAYTEGMYRALREKGWVSPAIADRVRYLIRNGEYSTAINLLEAF